MVRKAPSSADSFLGLGAELVILGLATGIAGLSDDVGTIMLTFMIGLLMLWLIYHVKITNAIPVFLGNLLPTR
jgi:hypothetical protein